MMPAAGRSPGRCGASDGEIPGGVTWFKIAPRKDGADYLVSQKFHRRECVLTRIDQDLLDPGRAGQRSQEGLKQLRQEIWLELHAANE